MDTVSAVKLIRALEKCLHDAQRDFKDDMVLNFLDAIHAEGFEIVKINPGPAEFQRKLQEAHAATTPEQRYGNATVTAEGTHCAARSFDELDELGDF